MAKLPATKFGYGWQPDVPDHRDHLYAAYNPGNALRLAEFCRLSSLFYPPQLLANHAPINYADRL